MNNISIIFLLYHLHVGDACTFSYLIYKTLNRLHVYHDTRVINVLDDRCAVRARCTVKDGGNGMTRVKRVFVAKAVFYSMIMVKKKFSKTSSVKSYA